MKVERFIKSQVKYRCSKKMCYTKVFVPCYSAHVVRNCILYNNVPFNTLILSFTALPGSRASCNIYKETAHQIDCEALTDAVRFQIYTTNETLMTQSGSHLDSPYCSPLVQPRSVYSRRMNIEDVICCSMSPCLCLYLFPMLNCLFSVSHEVLRGKDKRATEFKNISLIL